MRPLMESYGDALILYVNGYIHDIDAAEDLMIEAFARIMAKRPAIGEGAFKAYLFKTARNLALRHQQKSCRMNVFSIDGLDSDVAENILASANGVTAQSSPVEYDVGLEERKQILHMCLDRIEPELREALWLIYFEGLSYAEAASIMNVNSKRIDHLLQRGKRQMRNELVKEGIVSAYA